MDSMFLGVKLSSSSSGSVQRLFLFWIYTDTERVGSDSGGEGCSIFYLEVTGEAVLIGKTEIEEMQFQSTFWLQIPSL